MVRFRCEWQHCEFRANNTNLLKIHLLQILALSENLHNANFGIK